MYGVYQDIPRFYTALAEWAACVVYLVLMKKRLSKINTAACSVLMLLVQSAFLTLTGGLPLMFWIPCMLTAVGFMYLYLLGVCQVSVLEAGYCCAKAFLLAEFAASLEWQIHTWLLVIGFDSQWMSFLLLIAVYAAIMGLAVWLERPILTKQYLSQISVREFLSAVAIVAAVFALSNLSFLANNTPFTGQLRSDIFIIRTLMDLGGIAILYGFQSRISEYIVEKEMDSIQAMLKSQYEQYRNYQESMELISLKYHDLKHQIAGLRAETDTERRKEWLDAMEKELESNGLLVKTGNSVLDTILGGKFLYARKKKIQITCVADGALLEFMHVTDICTIFGNALDNAIESVVLLEDPKKRLIHVTVSARKNFIFIQISNYCEQELKWEEGGLPVTTKLDKKNHGFGLKSICYSVEKYGGSVSADMQKNWFDLRILIPRNLL